MPRLLLFLFLATLASARETIFRQVADTGTDTHIEATALFSKMSADGFLPVRVKLANNLKTDRSATLDFESTSANDLKANSSFEFTAPAGKTVTRDILVPLAPVADRSGSSQSLEIRLSGGFGSTANHLIAAYQDQQPSILLSEFLFIPNASTLDAEVASHFSGYGNNTFAGKFDPKQLPDDWRAFSGYDCVMMTDTDWTNIPPGGTNAILSWVRLGGRLVIFANTAVTPASLSLPADPGFGNIHIQEQSALPALNSSATLSLAIPPIAPLPRKNLLKAGFGDDWPLQKAFGDKAYHYALFIIVLLLFGILVGPVNLFVFAKSGKRHRLFITTPIISLATSLLLIALIIVADGFGGDGERIVLMEVRPDEGQNAAFVRQEQISRTGVLTRSAFSIDVPAFISPVPTDRDNGWGRFTNEWNANNGSYDLQPESGKLQASGDWFQSRSEQGQLITAVLPTRGRIESTGMPDTCISTFDFPIDTLYFHNAQGKWHRASDIATGKPFTLTPVDFSMISEEITNLQNRLNESSRDALITAGKRTNHCIAVTDSAPAIATHPGIDWKKTTTIITAPIVNP